MSGEKHPILWLRERDVSNLVSLSEAVGALETLLPLESRQEAINAPKSLIPLPGNAALHSLSSALTAQGYCGTKTWINAPAGAIALYLLFDSRTGCLLSIMEANGLGSLRTAGIAALAAQRLAPPGKPNVVIIGAGRQAFLQAAALTNVLALKQLTIFNRTRERQVALAERFERDYGVGVNCPETLEEAVRDASIVTVVTRAREPFLAYEMLGDNVHVNALGALLPTHAELYPSVLARADLVVVDNIANVKQASRELREFYKDDAAWNAAQTLGQLIAADEGRPPSAKLTVFKSVGMGLSDLAIAIRAYEAARRQQSGVAIDYPVASEFHWMEKAAQVAG
jgi:ornithine cyclodeaminase/alanine dehydrogenase-like protein (mu-crystallin family)